jgi:hypothetical protein
VEFNLRVRHCHRINGDEVPGNLAFAGYLPLFAQHFQVGLSRLERGETVHTDFDVGASKRLELFDDLLARAGEPPRSPWDLEVIWGARAIGRT